MARECAPGVRVGLYASAFPCASVILRAAIGTMPMGHQMPKLPR